MLIKDTAKELSKIQSRLNLASCTLLQKDDHCASLMMKKCCITWTPGRAAYSAPSVWPSGSASGRGWVQLDRMFCQINGKDRTFWTISPNASSGWIRTLKLYLQGVGLTPKISAKSLDFIKNLFNFLSRTGSIFRQAILMPF
jgi:hypothetical protein